MTQSWTCSIVWLLSSPTWAQEAPEPVTDSDTVSEPSAPEAEAPASPQLAIIVELTSGVRMSGTISQADLLTWAPGSPLVFTPDGGTATELSGDRIASLNAAKGTPTPTPTPTATAAPPAEPESDYVSPGGFKHPNPAASRYLYAPSSIPLKKGQGYVSQKLVFTSAAYALTDNFTMLYGAFTFFPPALSVFGTKASVKVKEGFHLSVGGEAFVLGLDQDVPAAIGFGAMTFGNEDKHLTIATGYAGGSMLDNATLPVMVGAQIRTKESIAVITENWVFFDVSDYLDGYGLDSAAAFMGSIALRLVGRRDRGNGTPRGMRTLSGHPRTTWDIGLVALGIPYRPTYYNSVTGDEVQSEFKQWDVFAPIPWVDWTWHFGEAR